LTSFKSKNQWKKHIFSSNLFKNEDFFKNKWLFKLLRKTCGTTFFENTFRCFRKCKIHFFCDVTKIENFDKKYLTLSKKNKKSPFKHIRFNRSKSPVIGLRVLQAFQETIKNIDIRWSVVLKSSGFLRVSWIFMGL
jgi:hypothetical protein